MGKLQLPEDFNSIVQPNAEAGRGPFPDAVHREKSRFLKWRREKRRRRMGLVMLREDDFAAIVQFLAYQLLHPDLFLDPQGNGFEKGANAGRSARQVGVQDPIKFQERFFIKNYKINFLNPDASLPQAIFDCGPGKGGIMFFAGETFLLCRSNNLSIANQARRAIVVKSGNAQNADRFLFSPLPNANVGFHSLIIRWPFKYTSI